VPARLRVVEVRLPPLRERREDIPALVEHLLSKISRELHKRIRYVSREALDVMTRYPWPGNVRELENALTRAAVISKGDVLEADTLPIAVDDVEEPAAATPDDDDAADWGQAEVQSEVQSEVLAGAKEARAEAPSSAAASAASAPVTTPLAAANGLWVPPSPGAVTGAGLWIPVTSAVLGVRSPLPPLPPPSAATSSAASSASSPTGNRPPAVEVPPQQARGLGAVPGGVVPGSCAFSDGGGDAAASTASAASLPTPPLPLASLTSPLPAPSPTHVGIASPTGPASEVVSPGERPPLTSTASKSERTAALLASISRAHAAQAQRSY
jgi:hypothetical protein